MRRNNKKRMLKPAESNESVHGDMVETKVWQEVVHALKFEDVDAMQEHWAEAVINHPRTTQAKLKGLLEQIGAMTTQGSKTKMLAALTAKLHEKMLESVTDDGTTDRPAAPR